MENASWLMIMVEKVCGEGRGAVFIHCGSSLRDMKTKNWRNLPENDDLSKN